MEPQRQPQLPQPISKIFIRGCSEDAQTELRSRIPIHAGGMLSDELLQRTLQAAKEFNARMEILVSQGLRREDFAKLPPEIQRKVKPPACDDGVNVTLYDPASLPQRIRVEGSTQESKLIENIAPADPRRSGEAGVVTLSLVVGKDGTVVSVNPVTGPELLIDPAVDAVRQWKYQPTLLNGLPVEVLTTVEVSFPPAG